MTTFLINRSASALITLPQPGESKSQYVPHAIRTPNGHIWVYVKGDESCSIHAHRSTNGGASFTWQGVVIAPTPGAWDSAICIDPVVAIDGETIHLYYKALNHFNGYGGHGLGHATAHISNPMVFTKDPLPLYTAAEMLVFVQMTWPSLGVTEIRDLYLSDVHRDPWNVPTFWGGFYGQHGTPYRIVRFRGDWTSFSPRAEGRIDPVAPFDFVQAPCVVGDPADPPRLENGIATGRYLCLFTEGFDGTNDDKRHLSAVTCAADGNWTWSATRTTVLQPSGGGLWDGRKAFAASVLKGGPKHDAPEVISGQWHLYYSGTSWAEPNKARSGLARLQPVDLVTI